MTFAIYNSTTGKIRCIANCPTGYEDEQASKEESWISVTGDINDISHYVDTVERSLVLIPTAPSANHTFDFVSKTWVDPRELDGAKLQAWDRIKEARTLAESEGFAYNGIMYDSDPISVQRIAGAVQLAMLSQLNSPPFSIVWTVQDNSTVTLNSESMIGVGEALGAHVNEVFLKTRVLRADINACTTISEADAIAW